MHAKITILTAGAEGMVEDASRTAPLNSPSSSWLIFGLLACPGLLWWSAVVCAAIDLGQARGQFSFGQLDFPFYVHVVQKWRSTRTTVMQNSRTPVILVPVFKEVRWGSITLMEINLQ